MRPLRQADFPRIWDDGDQRHELDRALVMLRYALPDWSYAELSRLSIGRRDALLLMLRRRTLGSDICFAVSCPCCGERLEDTTRVDELLLIDPWTEPAQNHSVALGECVLEFRLVDSQDLAVVIGLPGERAARELARRCYVSGHKGNEILAYDDLDAATRAQYALAVAEHDPQAELEFVMSCPACEHRWAILFDIVPFLWHEIVARAKLLLHDVHALAARYGWSEAEVLALAPARRAYYLEKMG